MEGLAARNEREGYANQAVRCRQPCALRTAAERLFRANAGDCTSKGGSLLALGPPVMNTGERSPLPSTPARIMREKATVLPRIPPAGGRGSAQKTEIGLINRTSDAQASLVDTQIVGPAV